jgi:hypothetical protein
MGVLQPSEVVAHVAGDLENLADGFLAEDRTLALVEDLVDAGDIQPDTAGNFDLRNHRPSPIGQSAQPALRDGLKISSWRRAVKENYGLFTHKLPRRRLSAGGRGSGEDSILFARRVDFYCNHSSIRRRSAA